MLAAKALMSALVCGTLRTFLGDFFSLSSGTNRMLLLAAAMWFCYSWSLSPLVMGFCAESAQEPLPVGETG
jgi:hypothetical protein